MNKEITILRTPGSTRWIVFQPEDDRFMKMKVVCGFSGECYCHWYVLKRDVPGMITELERDKYSIINY